MTQSTRSSVTTAPARTLSRMPGAPDDSTPITLTDGLIALTAIATPEIKPPPPIGTTIDVDVGPVANDLEAERALPGDELQIVERVHVGQPAIADELLRLLVGIVPDRAVQHDFGAVAARRRDLRRRRVLGHDDHRADAVDARGERHALRVIAGRGADDAAPALVLGKRHELVQRTADLVRPGALEHLRLEADVEAASARSASATTGAACDACAARHGAMPPRTPPGRAAAVATVICLGHPAVTMISTSPSAATSPDCTVARAGNRARRTRGTTSFIAREVLDVRQVHHAVDDVGRRAARRVERAPDSRQRLARLRADVALGLGRVPEHAREVHAIAGADRGAEVRIRPAGRHRSRASATTRRRA